MPAMAAASSPGPARRRTRGRLPLAVPRIRARAEASASPATVWALLSDPARWPDFDPLLAGAEGPTAVAGARWRLRGAGLPGRVVPWFRGIAVELERAEPEHELVLAASPLPGLRERIALRLLPLPRGRTDVELSATLAGPLAASWWPVARVAAPLVVRGLARAAAQEPGPTAEAA